MKLAEALILRADQKKRIEQLRQRILRNTKVQEGQQAAETPEALIQEMENTAGELLTLIQRINRTNSATPMNAGGTLADAIANGATHVHIHYSTTGQAARCTEERDLILRWHPVCNEAIES